MIIFQVMKIKCKTLCRCTGRNATVPLKALPDAFSYDNEVIIHYVGPEKPPIDAILKIDVNNLLGPTISYTVIQFSLKTI